MQQYEVALQQTTRLSQKVQKKTQIVFRDAVWAGHAAVDINLAATLTTPCALPIIRRLCLEVPVNFLHFWA
jgi:hypothetical protein